MTKVALDAVGTSTTLESNKSQKEIRPMQGCYWQASTGLRWHVSCIDVFGTAW